MRQLRYFCVFAFKSSCVVCCCEKKPGNRGRCGVGGVGGGHSGSGNYLYFCNMYLCISIVNRKTHGGKGALGGWRGGRKEARL